MIYVYGCGSERLCDFESFLRGGDIYWASRWWYAVLDAFLDAFRSTLYLCELTDSFYITCKTLHEKQQNASKSIFGRLYYVVVVVHRNFTLATLNYRIEFPRRASSPRRRVELFFDALHIYIERDSRDFCALRLYYYYRFIENARGASSMDFDAPQSSSSGTLILKCSMIASIFRSSFSVR